MENCGAAGVGTSSY